MGLPCHTFEMLVGGVFSISFIPLKCNLLQAIFSSRLTYKRARCQVLAPIFAFLLPKYQFSAANKKGTAVSRDPEALVAKYSDPLVYTGSIRIRTGYEILQISSYLQKNLSRLTVPFLVLHGTADTVTDPEASQKLYNEASSTDKTIKLLDGLLHDLLFEPEREEIVKGIIEWLNSRM